MKIFLTGRYHWFWLAAGLFLAAVAFRYFFIIKTNTPEHNAQLVEANLRQAILSNHTLITDIKETLASSQSFSDLYRESHYPYYIFLNRRILFWSKSDFVPNYQDVLGEYDVGFVSLDRGDYVVQKELLNIEQKSFEVVFMVPLTEEFTIVNEYLTRTYNRQIFTDGNFETDRLSAGGSGQTIKFEDRELFSIRFGSTYSNINEPLRIMLVLLVVFSLIALTMFIRTQLQYYVKDGERLHGFIFLLSSVVAVRSLMLLTGFPFDFVQIDIFNPRYYASSLVNPSLGDLLLNLIGLLFIGLFVFYNFPGARGFRTIIAFSVRKKLLLSATGFFLSFFWLAVHHQTMRTLNYDSQWTMDITQTLEFEYHKFVAFGIYFISVIVYFLFTHVSFRLFNKLNPHNDRSFFLALLIGIVAFLGFAWFVKWDYEVVIPINLVFFFAVRFFELHKYLGKLQYLTFIYFFSFGIPGAVLGVYANYQYNQYSTGFSKTRLANHLLVDRDFFTEVQLENIAKQIKEDAFIQKRIISPFVSKLIIAKKIRLEYITNLDQFDVQIFVFNSKGEPFEQFNIKDNYHVIRAQQRTFETEIDGLYYVNPGSGSTTTRYLNFIEIEDRDQVIGYILLDLRQKRLVPNSVFPLLINEGLYSRLVDNQGLLSYSVFVDKQLQYSSGPFNYRRYLDEFSARADQVFTDGFVLDGYLHKGFIGDKSRFVIISSKVSTVNQQFANFSFLFLIFIFAILLLLITIAIYQSFMHIKLNYSAKIQLYLNFAFFTPLIVVSVTTVSIIVQSFKTSLEAQYVEYGENLSGLIAEPLSAYRQLSIEGEDLSEQVSRMAEVADVDMNIFNTNGRLITSSLLQVYQNKIISNNIPPLAYIRIIENQESACVLEENVGLLKFKNVYEGVRSSETGAIIGVLSLPFFASKKDLEHRIINLLSYIINIFTFLFIIFIFVSFFVSRGLTFPLWLITQKIKRTTLSSFNEPLSWNSDDEIGMMVTEYNRMLVNLEESKKALAKSEKESAWREMARQVAHEIKNPLTPMKLTLQHMKRIMDSSGNGEETEKKQKQINALLEQIETLSDIATSFSDFAKMPAPVTGLLDIRALLVETIELYDKKELGQIIPNLEEGEFMIEGDKKWLGRAFSNLIINGFQAVGSGRKAVLDVRLFSSERNRVHIEISDNGEGIPDHIADKVFTPNFSTKYSGSGLGLAITRKGVEHAGGRIWFESIAGQGTTFHVEIPLV